MPAYPVLFGFRMSVAGKGFLAGIHIDGRALLEEEDGAWWAYGVDPGPFAASGTTPIEAFQAFRQSVLEVLFDSASLTENYESFEADVRKIFTQRSEEDAARWEAARRDIREGRVTPEAPFDALPQNTDVFTPNLIVVQLDKVESQRFSPSDNHVDQLAAAA